MAANKGWGRSKSDLEAANSQIAELMAQLHEARDLEAKSKGAAEQAVKDKDASKAN